MMCAKCQRLSTAGGHTLSGHSDLAHVATRFHKTRVPSPLEARTEEYACKTCNVRWEIDLDPTDGIGYSAFRQMT